MIQMRSRLVVAPQTKESFRDRYQEDKTALLAALFLGERLSLQSWTGIACICAGVGMIAVCRAAAPVSAGAGSATARWLSLRWRILPTLLTETPRSIHARMLRTDSISTRE